MRIKKVYVINTPALFDIIMAIAKPFIKPKLLERACFLGSDTEKLRELIPDDLIPEALGGTFESYDYDELEKDLQSKAAHFKMMNLCRSWKICCKVMAAPHNKLIVLRRLTLTYMCYLCCQRPPLTHPHQLQINNQSMAHSQGRSRWLQGTSFRKWTSRQPHRRSTRAHRST